MIYLREFYNDKGKSPKELSDRYKTFYSQNANGNYEWTLIPYNWRERRTAEDRLSNALKWDIPTYYDDLVDDTNMNLSWLLLGKNTDLFEMTTEWVNCHSEHLLKEWCGDKYEYLHDNDGNIIQINEYMFDDLRKIYKLFYLK